jgi:hypothetical protein
MSANSKHFAMAAREKGKRYSAIEALADEDSDKDNMSGSSSDEEHEVWLSFGLVRLGLARFVSVWLGLGRFGSG